MQCQVTAVTRVNYLGNAKKVKTISSTKEVEFVTQPPEGSGGVFCGFVPPQSSLDFHLLCPSVLFVHFSPFSEGKCLRFLYLKQCAY